MIHFRRYWPVLALAILWFDLIHILSYTWSTREQYAYGWFVPFFAVYLFGKRWCDRPVVEESRCEDGYGGMIVVIALITFVLIPVRVIAEVNADWPLITYVLTSVVVMATMYGLFLAGGWPWVRHFIFPTAFILVAVAWPYRIEKPLTQNLMQAAAGLTADVLGWVGIPALQRGNLIELENGVLGVDEACSGIRSLQSTLMAGLLMGELYRHTLRWRVLLVAIGLAMAFAFNVARTLLLSWIASGHGVASVDQWHDSAGFSILVSCFICLWAVSVAIKRTSTALGNSTVPHRANIFEGDATLMQSIRVRGYLICLGAIGVLGIGLTELWYRLNEAQAREGFQWTLAFPTNSSRFKFLDVAPKTMKLLGHDTGGAATWVENDGSEWSVFFFRWNARSIQNVMLARAHRPEVCLPASGLRQIGDSIAVTMEAGAVKVPFRAYTYEGDGQTFQVFFCQWEDRASQQTVMQSSKQFDRLYSVLSGRRRVGHQTLEFIVRGHSRMETAQDALRMRLPALIQREM